MSSSFVNISAPTTTTMKLQQQQSTSNAIEEAIQQAAEQVTDKHQQDISYPDLSQLLGVTSHTNPTVSGVNDNDYPSLSSQQIGLGNLAQLSNVRRVPLPPELIEQFSHMQCSCLMGLFPEVTRAWLAIDSDFFIWNYEDGSDLAYFDGLSEVILSTALVKPKPGIFQPYITYLLCLTTPIEIVLLGVSFADSQESTLGSSLSNEMHLLPDPLFAIATDNNHMMSVASTSSGRIFLAGKDGCLYEIYYQATDGWFSRRCRKINHSKSSISFLVPSFLNFAFSSDDALVQVCVDETRHIIYTRSEKGTIQVYDLGSDGQGMARVAAMSLATIQNTAAYIARTIDKTNFNCLVHLSAVDLTESTDIHLVAITDTGVRLYFCTTPFQQPLKRPSQLALVHVRLPPGFTTSTSPNRPTRVHAAHYRKGLMMLSCAQTEDSDRVWCIGGDSFPFQVPLVETNVTNHIEGRTWVISEYPCEPSPIHVLSMGPGLWTVRPDPPSVVTQHVEQPHKLILLGAQGTFITTKLRPVEQLRQLMITNAGPDCEPVEAYFRLHKEEQACATCLILSCSLTMADDLVRDWAKRAFFRYGGEPRIVFPAVTDSGITPSNPQINQTLSTSSCNSPVWSVTPDLSPIVPSTLIHSRLRPGMSSSSTPLGVMEQTPSLRHQSMILGGGMSTHGDSNRSSLGPQVIYSGKLNGIYLYFTRILRTVWNDRMVRDHQTGPTQYELYSRFNSQQLSQFILHLEALKQFLDENSQFPGQRHEMLQTGQISNMHQRMLSFMRPGSITTTTTTNQGQLQEQLRQKYQAEANLLERSSLINLQHLLDRTIEALALWSLLVVHDFHILVKSMSEDFQLEMKSVTFAQFVVYSNELMTSLITALINHYVIDNSTVDAISEKLRLCCPSLYSNDDALFAKASEKLQAATSNADRVSSEGMLAECLELFIVISHRVNLSAICDRFHYVHYYKGIISLCLSAAQKCDSNNIALHFYENKQPVDDTQGQQAYSARSECYKCITDVLSELFSTARAYSSSSSLPTNPGIQDGNHLELKKITSDDALKYIDEVIRCCLSSKDQLLHVALYNWLVATGLTDKLLEISSPYVESYLLRSSENRASALTMLDLLWKYYEKVGKYGSAAHILSKLADRYGTDISLQQRVEYLSRACMSAKSGTMTIGLQMTGEILHELQEKLDVARLQVEIFETLNNYSMSRLDVQEALSQLNCELMDISKLYSEYAEVFGIPVCKLAIIHCADHYDQPLIDQIWQDIIDQDLSSTVGRSTETRMTSLSSCIESVGKIYLSSEHFFPLDVIIKHMEIRACALKFSQNFTFSTLSKLTVSVLNLLQAYTKVYNIKDPCWQQLRRPYYLLHSVYGLINSYVQSQTTVPSSQRRHLTITCQDCVTSYLVDLQAIANIDNREQELMSNFKSLQSKLARML